MQMLEMEEVESLVGMKNVNRKRLGGGINGRKKTGELDTVLTCLNQSKLLPRVVVCACLILLGVLYLSAQDESTTHVVKNPASSQNNLSASEPPLLTAQTESNPPEDASPRLSDSAVAEHSSKEDPKNSAFLYSKYATVLPLVDNPFPTEEEKKALEEKFGRWKFWDGEEDERPMEDYTAKYPNRDMPGEDFLDEAWQADAVFVNHILNDADKLIARTMEAIYIEYGHGKPLPPEGLAERMKMFHWSRENLSEENAQPPEKYSKRGDRGNGGWTTQRSFAGLVRRLLHAMMTQDTFTVVMGGHSAAQGQGNHFRQSYMMQFHKIMYPIFARLGVKLITRNVGQGGLGTIQAGMGSGSIYGDEVDVLMWDSGMTETASEHVDVFYRQALLAGNRVPVLWGGPFQLLKMLHEEADVDVGDWGTAMDGIKEIESAEDAESVPWAARYLKCKDEVANICKEEPRFCAKCWIDREDKVTPDSKQLDHPKGQVKWHPGWRNHQLMGRNLAFAILEALQAAVDIWTEGVMGGPPLEDEEWHVTEYYENIRNKVKNLDQSLGTCYKISDQLPTRLCNTPMKAKSQYTPRANFDESALTSIIKPTPDGYVPKNENTMLYEGPDAHNTCFDIPEGEVNVFNVVTGRRQLSEESIEPGSYTEPSGVVNTMYDESIRYLKENIKPGKGWVVEGEPPGLCDGTYNATCGRSAKDECVLYGHHDGRGAVIGNEHSGWLVMTLKDLKEGIIILKLHTWYFENENDSLPKGRRGLGQRSYPFDAYERINEEFDHTDDRKLMRSYETPELPDSFAFEYAIDGEITTLTKDKFMSEKKQIQRVVETITILDNPDFTSEPKDVEIAIRLRGSGSAVVFGLSHVYWA